MDKLLDIKQVSWMVGLNQSTIYRYINNEDFPTPVKVNGGLSRWRMEDVEQWIFTRPCVSI